MAGTTAGLAFISTGSLLAYSAFTGRPFKLVLQSIVTNTPMPPGRSQLPKFVYNPKTKTAAPDPILPVGIGAGSGSVQASQRHSQIGGG